MSSCAEHPMPDRTLLMLSLRQGLQAVAP